MEGITQDYSLVAEQEFWVKNVRNFKTGTMHELSSLIITYVIIMQLKDELCN